VFRRLRTSLWLLVPEEAQAHVYARLKLYRHLPCLEERSTEQGKKTALSVRLWLGTDIIHLVSKSIFVLASISPYDLFWQGGANGMCAFLALLQNKAFFG